MGIMFNNLSEGIFITILDNHLLFNYKDVAKELLELH